MSNRSFCLRVVPTCFYYFPCIAISDNPVIISSSVAFVVVVTAVVLGIWCR